MTPAPGAGCAVAAAACRFTGMHGRAAVPCVRAADALDSVLFGLYDVSHGESDGRQNNCTNNKIDHTKLLFYVTVFRLI